MSPVKFSPNENTGERVQHVPFAMRIPPKLNKALLWCTGIKGKVVGKVQLRSGYKIPWGWGVSYYKFDQDASVIFPIPLNWVVGLTRSFYWILVKGPKPNWYEKHLWAAEQRAYNRAYEQIRLNQEQLMREVLTEFMKERVK